MAQAEMDLTFYVNGDAAPLGVKGVRGREAICELFRFEIDLTDETGTFDFDACIGEPAHLIVRWGETERHFDGIVSSFVELETTSGGSTYRVELVPLASLLGLGQSSRVFSGVTVPELLEKVLSEHGVTNVRLSLTSSYSSHDILVQYRESAWDFLSRWMEREGIRCFFEHSAEGHTLVISDAPTTHDDIGGAKALAYRDEALDAGENILTFELSRRMVPARVTTRDYPFDSPTGKTEETAEVEGGGKGSIYDFPATGAKKRLDALRAAEKIGRGTSSSIRMTPGHLFELENHPRASYNATWLLTAVEHRIALSELKQASYKATFECVPGAIAYRPPQKTPWPRILGAQMATVSGPDGEEIHTDSEGRTLAVFHWDQGSDGGGTPVWLPLSQAAASQGFGSVRLPRVGDAVLVEFLDGDPARPVVTGSMYTKVKVHPYTLPANRTKTVLRDASSPGGDGYNELTFDSAAGSEEVYLRAQRNSRVEVQNDASRTVGNDDSLTIEGDRKVNISGASTGSVGGDETLSVVGSQSLSITGSQSIAVATSQTVVVTGDRTVGVGGDLQVSVEGSRSTSIAGDDELSVAGSVIAEVSGSRVTSVSGDDYAAISGSRAESIEGNLQVLVDGQTFQSHGSLYVSVTGETSYTHAGDVTLESSTIQKIGAPKIYIAAGTNLYLRALESITLEVGDSTLTVEDGQITITNGGAKKSLTGDVIYMNT